MKCLIIIDARCKHEDNKLYLTLCKKATKDARLMELFVSSTSLVEKSLSVYT